jgi:hypothetical protein
MEELKNILKDTLKQRKIYKRVIESLVFVIWDEVIGEKLCKYTCPSYLKNGVLFVNVPNSMWSHHLSFLKPDIIERINTKIGNMVVKDLRFKLGTINYSNRTVSFKENERNLNDIYLTAEEDSKIDRMLSHLKDEELRRLLKSIISIDYKNKKWMEQNNWKRCKNCRRYYKSKRDVCAVCASSIYNKTNTSIGEM